MAWPRPACRICSDPGGPSRAPDPGWAESVLPGLPNLCHPGGPNHCFPGGPNQCLSGGPDLIHLDFQPPRPDPCYLGWAGINRTRLGRDPQRPGRCVTRPNPSALAGSKPSSSRPASSAPRTGSAPRVRGQRPALPQTGSLHANISRPASPSYTPERNKQQTGILPI